MSGPLTERFSLTPLFSPFLLFWMPACPPPHPSACFSVIGLSPSQRRTWHLLLDVNGCRELDGQRGRNSRPGAQRRLISCYGGSASWFRLGPYRESPPFLFRGGGVTEGTRSLQTRYNRQACYLCLKELVCCDNQLGGEMKVAVILWKDRELVQGGILLDLV